METEYKSVDSPDEYRYPGCRVIGDPESKNTRNGLMVSFKIVSTSRNKGKNDIDDLWIVVKPSDYHAEAASFLRNKDVLHEVRGKPILRRFGEGKRMIEVVLERAQIIFPSELKRQLKERGWAGGAATAGRSGGFGSTRHTNQRREIEPLPED